ncbi:MAG: DNA mismatch repair protein MutS [Provencibacterium sp.]|jgi:DNA mismatch repair protein MutS2|nr:DNA mismatch repair protein MutS [Provencibacterium sp.]
MNPVFTLLQFEDIRGQLCALALSERAKQRLCTLSPCKTLEEAKIRQGQTTEARQVIESFGSPPLSAMQELDKCLTLCAGGGMLLPAQLMAVMQFIASCRRMRAYLKKAMVLGTEVAGYGAALGDTDDLYEEIDRCIVGEQVDSAASAALRDIRRRMENLRGQVKAKLASILQAKRQIFSDSSAVMRNGRFVLPVKREYRSQLSGTLVDVSGTGATCFIEPSAVSKIQQELAALGIEEENEVRRILYTLSSLVDDFSGELRRSAETMEALDVVFACGRLSIQMEAAPPQLTSERRLHIRAGRHPLLSREKAVPLDFWMGEGINGVVITGPNTGGKTVALKTVGLLSMMAQSGLHVPADRESVFCMHSAYWCDIGDGQSISENLSTFSAHMKTIISILQKADAFSLVLMDELGSGTDPAEGMGLAIAILEELKRRGCLFLTTSHYPEVKEYAARTPGLCNARMAFDRQTLQPLYRLELGLAGESCALYIARRLGLPGQILERAEKEAKSAGGPGRPAEAAKEPLPLSPPAPLKEQAERKQEENGSTHPQFSIGDSILVLPEEEAGLVFAPEDEHGKVGVQVKGEKRRVLYKRLKLRVPASELYPPDYDFSILFDTVENRKARRAMEKGHRPDLAIHYAPNACGESF